MTALALGANWRKATAEQQKALIEQFRTLLVRTYSSALSSYRNQTIDVKAPRGRSGDADVVVRSEIKQPGAEAVTIDYSMEKSPEGWKVYDISVAGVSLVTTYRETFSAEVRQTGIEGLIKSLSEKNRQLGAKST
jgi:phospholipid transport system substrate-binding protein